MSFKEFGVSGTRSNLLGVGISRRADCLASSRGDNPFSAARLFSLSSSRNFTGSLAAIFLSCLLLGLSGCGSTKPTIGAISVTDPSGVVKGQLNSVIVNATVAISVPVSNDGNDLGVDWNLNCGGSSNPLDTVNICGTLNPVHVGSNINMLFTAPAYVPLGNTVTLTATATSDPSVSSSVTLSILPQPITIAFSANPNLPPATMGASETAQITATVTNDPIAAGVSWKVTCGSGDCGSFNPAETASGYATVYTAPAKVPSGGSVTVIATSIKDPTKSVNAQIAIKPVSVTVSPEAIKVPLHATAALTATVAYDAFNAGVIWGAPVCASPGACGSISPAQTASGVATTYTTPNAIPAGGGKVTVTAKSVTDPQATATVTITIAVPPPITVSVAPAVPVTQIDGSTTVTATVDNDYANAGVTWECSPGICTSTTAFTANFLAPTTVPQSGTVSLKATSITDPSKNGTATIKVIPRISIAFTTSPSTVTAGVPTAFSATVTNDIAAGGLDWTASNCGGPNCGTFNSGNPNAPNHSASGASINYTAPVQLPATTVTITATSTTSETVSPIESASTTTTVIPVTYVHFVPFAPSTLPVTNPSAPILVSLVAVAANDTTNAGVDWAVCNTASTCGEFQVAPGIPATATTLAIPPVYSATLHAASGQAVSYLPPTQVPGTGSVTITVTSTADKIAHPKNPASAAPVIAVADDSSGVLGVALKGKVQAGTLAVSGASVYLYAAGNQCYGASYGTGSCQANNLPLTLSNGALSVTTAADGSFTIPAGYTCPAQTSELYLVALGGAPGGTKNNPQLGLMTAIGQCSNLNSSVPLIVNEITTVASTWALVPFTGTSYADIGSSSSNYTTGLANAFQTVNNLVDITTGVAFTTTPAGYGTVPQAEINTLADAIDTCAITAGGAPGDGSPCSAFFEASNVSPLGEGIVGNAPTSVLQAVLEVAQYPSSTYGATKNGYELYFLAAAATNPPFSPILQSSPSDWTIALSFTGGGLGGNGQTSPQSSAMAIDASGNVWIANLRISSVSELSNLGAPLSPFATGTKLSLAGGFVGGGINQPQQIAIDLEGSAWVLNGDGSLSEFDYTGKPVNGSPFSGVGTMTGNGLAIDGSGSVWVANSGTPGDVAEIAGYYTVINGKQIPNGTPVSPAGGYVNGIESPNGAIAVDGSGTVWVLDTGNSAAAELSSANGALLQTDFGYLVNPVTGKLYNPPQSVLNANTLGTTMAIDNAGDVFIPNPNAGGSGQIIELLAGGSTVNDGGIGQSLGLTIPPTYAPIAIDGSGHMWLMAEPNQESELPSGLAELSKSGSALNTNSFAPGFVGPNLESGPASIAVDGSGNVWVLTETNNSTVTEFVGVATPVVTPLALGVQTKSLGKKP